VKVLFVGDVVGQPGRRAVQHLVPRLRQQWSVDVVVVNGENAAGGSGINSKTAADLFNGGADVITTGDHVWDQKEVVTLLQNDPRVLRPVNYPPSTVGRGSYVLEKPGQPAVGVVCVQGRTFMAAIENPFLCLPIEIARLREVTPIIIVDIHAEATSEKIALGRLLDGQVSAVLGTHTHVQTADERIFPGGTAYLTDAGFTGPYDSVLGREIAPVIRRFTTNLPQRFEIAGGRVFLQGALVDIDNATGRATGIQRVFEELPPEANPGPTTGV
jgi:metallophosphoesterase (TIGR00282 family)